MDETYFKQLFDQIVAVYQIPPDTAAELLRRILDILSRDAEDSAPDNNHN